MPKFMTIGYGDRAGYDRTPKEICDAAHAHDAELQKSGAVMGVAGPPVQVRNPSAAGVPRQRIPPSCRPRCRSQVSHLLMPPISPRRFKIVSKTPCAVAHGVVEVWPLEEASIKSE